MNTEFVNEFYDLCKTKASCATQWLQRAELQKLDLNDSRIFTVLPLHYAVQFGAIGIVRELLGKVDIFARGHLGQTALHVAAREDFIEAFEAILNFEEKKRKEEDLIDVLDYNQRNILHLAVYFNATSIVELILSKLEDSKRSQLLLAKDLDGNTVLHLAVSRNSLTMYRRLLDACETDEEQKTLLNSVDKGKFNILHLACWLKSAELISEILSRKVDHGEKGGRGLGFSGLFALTASGQTALELIVERDNLQVTKAFLQSCDNVEERRRVLNAVDKNGHNLLHFCVIHDSTRILSHLLESGLVDVNCQSVENNKY